MAEKSYVGMTQCFYCGEPSGLVLDTRLRDRFERNVGVVDMTPCNKCAELMKMGIMIISVRSGESGKNPYRTGRMAVIKDEAFRDMLPDGELRDDILASRWTFMDDETWDAFGLPREDIDNREVGDEL